MLLSDCVLSIVPDDGLIVANGEARAVDFAGLKVVQNIRAIQWNGKSGIIEFKQGAAQFFDNFLMVGDIAAMYGEPPEPAPEVVQEPAPEVVAEPAPEAVPVE